MIEWNRIACIVAAALATAAQAQVSPDEPYYVISGGAQFAIGEGLPLPVQTFPSPNQTGVGTNFPPLLIPPASNATVRQSGAFPPALRAPIGVFQRVPSGPSFVGVANNNPRVWQVRTNLQFTGPGFTSQGDTSGSVTLSAGRRTGAKTATFPGIPAGSKVQYSKSLSQFGGPARTRMEALSPVLLWVHAETRKAPCKHTSLGGLDADCIAQHVHQYPRAVAAGAPVGFSTTSPTVAPPEARKMVGVNVTAMGQIVSEASLQITGVLTVTNRGTSEGFPWTTGRLRISQPSALGTQEVFTITGQDGRTGMNAGGTLSLVAGALSDRTLTGPNANRAWTRFVLPEPGALLSALSALAALGLCHALLRPRR